MQISADFLRTLAHQAAQESLPRFRQPGNIGNKLADGFDPVTEADRETERVIRELIESHYPEHGIIGEEFGAKISDSRFVWIIDPIDGTRAYISGLPVWGTLVGLIDGDHAIAGLLSQPFTGELYYADGKEARYEGPGGNRQLLTRPTVQLADATMFTTSPALYDEKTRRSYNRLEAAVKLPRYGVDCYAFAMVAAGYADLVVEPELLSYDVAALVPIIEQAGGVITRWDGAPAHDGGNILAAATSQLHSVALEMLNS